MAKTADSGTLLCLFVSVQIFLDNKERSLSRAGHTAGIGRLKNIYSDLLGKLEARRLLEIPRRRWEDKVKTDLKETANDGLELFIRDKRRTRVFNMGSVKFAHKATLNRSQN
jgi:hypothetical protein